MKSEDILDELNELSENDNITRELMEILKYASGISVYDL